MNKPQLRIVNCDPHNWVIERWESGGIISRGPYVGKPKKEGWNRQKPIGYFPTLAYAAKRLLDEELKNLWPTDGWTGEDMRAAIQEAETRVLAAVEAATK